MNDVLGQGAREALGETSRRCTATNRLGEQCRNAPIVGGFVCSIHGGKVPAVQRTARQRLLAMVDPALSALLRALESHGPPCPHCGRSDGDRDPVVIRAAQLVLDRSGYGPSAKLILEKNRDDEDLTQLTNAELAERADAIAIRIRQLEAERPVAEEGVVLDDEA